MRALRTSLLSLTLLAGTLPSSGCGILLDAACDAAFSSSKEEKRVEKTTTVEVVECTRCHRRHSGCCDEPRTVRTVTTTTTTYEDR
jgi:hypothetical protein